ncbi:hypothetical protein KAR91_10490 [Candidatus Pacearchaeota archaeon]|nr:hypothetical protein [Candidatus Pacearchaeota archaeon]
MEDTEDIAEYFYKNLLKDFEEFRAKNHHEHLSDDEMKKSFLMLWEELYDSPEMQEHRERDRVAFQESFIVDLDKGTGKVSFTVKDTS